MSMSDQSVTIALQLINAKFIELKKLIDDSDQQKAEVDRRLAQFSALLADFKQQHNEQCTNNSNHADEVLKCHFGSLHANINLSNEQIAQAMLGSNFVHLQSGDDCLVNTKKNQRKMAPKDCVSCNGIVQKIC